MARVIRGKQEAIDLTAICLLAEGHLLIEDVPGVGKTSLAKALSASVECQWRRVQFTPDLLPTDLLGVNIWLKAKEVFEFQPGPVFGNMVLADEINRTPPKTQSALLEAMQERRVTSGGKTYDLPAPFFVLATQNPIEQEGTYPLPEAQLDRFMMNIWVDYPTLSDEIQIVKSTTSNVVPQINSVVSGQEIAFYQQLIRKMPVTDNVIEYAVKLVAKTRPQNELAPAMVNNFLSWGAGPRASQFLIVGAKCVAALKGKYSPDIEDVRSVAVPILRHRIVRNYKAEAEGYTVEKIIAELL
jgi:MoxR-like ATPase